MSTALSLPSSPEYFPFVVMFQSRPPLLFLNGILVFRVSVMGYPDKKRVMEGRVYLYCGLQFQRGYCELWGRGMAVGEWGCPGCQETEIQFHSHTGSKVGL